MADKREVLYQAISRDIEVMRDELMIEVRNSIAQVEALRNAVKNGNEEACELITKEIRYGYKQNENIYSGMESILNDGVDEKLSALDGKLSALADKLSALENMQATLDQLRSAEETLSSKVDGVDKTLGDVNTRLADAYLPTEEQCQKLVDGVNNNVEVHNQRVLDAIAAIPQADEVDYTRIVEEVGDKVSALIDAIPQAKETEIDYDRIIDTTADRVAENIPAAEQVDYARIEGDVINALEKALDMEAIAAAVAAKIAIPAPVAVEVDYERLADMVAERLAAKEKTFEIVLDDEGLTKIAEKVAEKLVVEDEETEETYDLVLDEEGIQAIAKGVAEELRESCCCQETQPVVAAVEETAEEPWEAPVEEQPVEEVAESAAEQPVEEELAAAIVPGFEEIGDGKYMDAETGLVIRLKKSFTAKMKQSDEKVKEFYSALKNELVSYKRINSNVSWHGDRFNYGRDTVAKMNIVGKTLGLYLALDPNDEEFKTTVYHQKDVSKQKAYEHTPFMVKVKSDAAVKKARRLVVALAGKLETEKEDNFVATDYTKEYEYATTKQLYDEGHIKATKDKKVDLDF